MAFRAAVVIASFLIGFGALARESFAQYYPPQAYPPPPRDSRAPSSHVVAAPPSSAMDARRLMLTTQLPPYPARNGAGREGWSATTTSPSPMR